MTPPNRAPVGGAASKTFRSRLSVSWSELIYSAHIGVDQTIAREESGCRAGEVDHQHGKRKEQGPRGALIVDRSLAKKVKAGHLDDAWIQIDRSEDPSFFIRFLDATRAHGLELARKDPAAAFAHLALRPGLSVLDCGCGTGDMLSIIADQVAPGRVLGGDISSTMTQEARRRAADGPSNIQFEQMDAQALPLPDETFDRVLATQLLIHVPDPARAFQELCRVLAAGGRIALADMDWDTLVFGCDDKEIGRRFTRLFSDGIRHGVIVREYAGWLRAAGFTNVQVLPQPMPLGNWDAAKAWIFDPSLSHFVATGAMSRAEADALMNELVARSDSGRLFIASTFYTVVGDRGRA